MTAPVDMPPPSIQKKRHERVVDLENENARLKAQLLKAKEALQWAWGTIYQAHDQPIEDEDRDQALEKLDQTIRAIRGQLDA